MRIRQVVHIVNDLDAAEKDVVKCLDSPVTFRDPNVAVFGLKNALIPIGNGPTTCFLEILSPIKKDGKSTGGRYLKRLGEGGYMLIFQVDNYEVVNQRIQNMGFSPVFKAEHGDWPPNSDKQGIRGIHYNPRDFGLILSIDEAIPKESWSWAGEEWMKRNSRLNAEEIVGVEIESNRPGELAGRWAFALGCQLIGSKIGRFTLLMTDGGRIYFVQKENIDNTKAKLTGRITTIEMSSITRPNTCVTIYGMKFRFVPRRRKSFEAALSIAPLSIKPPVSPPTYGMYSQIKYRVVDPVAVIWLSRPRQLNALTPIMLEELKHALMQAENDTNVAGIVITGDGRGFCAGFDLGNLSIISKNSKENKPLLRKTSPKTPPKTPGAREMGEGFFTGELSYLLAIRKPIVCCVNGPAAGMGFALALHCDVRMASDRAIFVSAFSKLGLVAEHGMSYLLPHLVGQSQALDILWTSRRVSGREAKEIGLVTHLTKSNALLRTGINYIEELSKIASPVSLMTMKQQVYRHMGIQYGDQMIETDKLTAMSVGGDDFKEGVKAFLGKREPHFQRIQGEKASFLAKI